MMGYVTATPRAPVSIYILRSKQKKKEKKRKKEKTECKLKYDGLSKKTLRFPSS